MVRDRKIRNTGMLHPKSVKSKLDFIFTRYHAFAYVAVGAHYLLLAFLFFGLYRFHGNFVVDSLLWHHKPGRMCITRPSDDQIPVRTSQTCCSHTLTKATPLTSAYIVFGRWFRDYVESRF